MKKSSSFSPGLVKAKISGLSYLFWKKSYLQCSLLNKFSNGSVID